MSQNLSIRPMLCPPGNGVFTVNTAKERKEELHQLYYQEKNPQKVEEQWLKSLEKLKDTKLALLGVCSDCGGGIQRGANWGPLFLRQSLYNLNPLYKNPNFVDMGDIRVIPHLLHDKYLNEATIKGCRKALYNDESSKLPVSPLSQTEEVLNSFYELNPQGKVITLGGDHSVSYPAVKTYLQHKLKQKKKVALIHFDAHTDLLHERLGIDLCFGSWVTHILSDLPGPEYCFQLGIRSSGKDRGHWEQAFGIQQFWNYEFKKEGAKKISQLIIEDLKKKGVEEIYVSFDIDALDETEASATGTPEENGLMVDECLNFLYLLSEEFAITGADLMEVAPFLNMPTKKPKINPEPQATLLAAQSILNFFVECML